MEYEIAVSPVFLAETASIKSRKLIYRVGFLIEN